MVNGIEDSTRPFLALFPANPTYYKDLGERERGRVCLSSLHRKETMKMFRAIGEKGGWWPQFVRDKVSLPRRSLSFLGGGDTGKTDRQRTAHQFEPLRK